MLGSVGESWDCVCHVAGRAAVGAAATTTTVIATTEVEQQALLVVVVVVGVVEPAFVVVVVVLLGAAIYSHVEPLGERHRLLRLWMGVGMDGMGIVWFGGEGGGIWCRRVDFGTESALRIPSVLCAGWWWEESGG